MWGDVLRVVAVMALLGLAAQPIARAALAPLPGAAAGLARPLGIVLAAVPVWLLASIGVISYTETTAWFAVGALVVAGAVVFVRGRRGDAPRSAAAGALLLGAELTFLATFLLAVVVVSHSPDVWGTEKPMDMAFLTAIDQSQSFPPPDPWLAGEDLNYYYLGQYLIGFVTRLAGLGPTEAYNLAIALVWALGASAAFGLGGAATAALRRGGQAPGTAIALLGGTLAALLTVVGGNFEGLRLWLVHDGPLAGLNWFGASRVVPGGINDFPSFELLVGDLHAHAIAVPFTLLGLAFVLHAALYGPQLHWRVAIAAVVTGALYPINSWSFPVCLGLILLAGALQPRPWRRLGGWAGALVAISLLVYLPFYLHFDPGGARGVAINPERRGLGDFLGDLLRVYGFALLPLLIATAWALPKRARYAALAALVAVPLLAPLDDLGGPALLAIALAGALAAAVVRSGVHRFAFLLVAGGLVCALAPELVYLRDAFEGSAVYRMNTVFKVGFNAWLLFGVAAAVLIATGVAALPARGRRVAAVALVPLAAATLAFPYVGARAKADAYTGKARLDGLRWLDAIAPGDRPAIAWLRDRTPRGTVILEATGPEYSPQGHARMATFSGRPTIVGWAAHELFWGPAGRLGTRVQDVNELYTTTDATRTRQLLDRYRVAYVVVGPTERATYQPAGVDKFATLGRRVFERAGTSIYDVRRT